MALYRDEVIVLAAKDIGEGDRIYTFFGKRRGKFRAVARGVRKLTSRKRGHLGTFNLCRVLCAEGRNLDILSEAESDMIIDPTELDPVLLERMGFIVLVLNKLTAEEDPDGRLYSIAERFIKSEHTEIDTFVTACTMLKQLGFLSEEQEAKLSSDMTKGLEILKKYVRKIVEQGI